MESRFKEPSESLEYGIDWAPLLADNETISTHAWQINPAGLSSVDVGHTATVSTVRVAGGVVGTEYEVQGTVTTSAGNTLVSSFLVLVDDEPASVPGERYCTVAQARAQGAQGSTRDVEAAIVAATARVDSYTGDRFTPRTMTVVARVGGDGRAMLPHRLTSTGGVTQVEDADDGRILAASVFRAYSSATPGDVDAIGLGRGHVGANMLVVGLEPWNSGNIGTQRVRVTGQFGWDTTPVTVQQATAILAAQGSRTETNAGSTPAAVDPEGNVIPVVPPFAADEDDVPEAEASRTTGSRRVDAMLSPYRRHRTLVGI